MASFQAAGESGGGTREEALAAVQTWVERIGSSQDAALSLQPAAAEDAQRLLGFYPSSGEDLDIALVLGWLSWYRHLALDTDEDQLRMAVRAFAPCFVEGFGSLPEPVLPLLADFTGEYAIGLVAQAATSADPATVASISALWRRMLAATPPDSPERPGRLSCLGNVLRFSSRLSGAAAELDESIELHQEAVATSSADDHNWAAILGNLAGALALRFDRTGARADLDQVITSLTEAAAGAPPGAPGRVSDLSSLGGRLNLRFTRFGDPADVDRAVTMCRQAVSEMSADFPERSDVLGTLAAALHSRFERSESAADLDEAISLYQAGLESMPPGDPQLATMSSALAEVLRRRFARTGATPDLMAAVTARRTAVTAAPPGNPSRPVLLSNLSLDLDRWFDVTGDVSGLDEAVAAGRDAVALSAADDPLLARHLDNLRQALRDRFEGKGDRADLDEAIEMGRTAILGAAAGDPDRARLQRDLGNGLQVRASQTGTPADLDEAVTVHRAAFAATPADDPGWFFSAMGLGTALRSRFVRLGRAEDLDEAIVLLRDALAVIPAGDYNRAKCLTNLGSALWNRFDRTADQAELDEAIALLREAVAAGPAGRPQSAIYLNNLGGALRARYLRTGATEDLDESIDIARRALAAIPPGHLRIAWFQSNLGGDLQLRYRRTGSGVDLDEAVDLQRAAVLDITDQEGIGRYRFNLATALFDRYRRTGSPGDLDEAVDLCRASATAAQSGDVGRAASLNQLGSALWTRFDATGSAADLDEAVTVLRSAVAASPPGAPGRADALTNLGVTLRSRFQRPGGGAPADLRAAIETLVEATRIARARPTERIRAARTVSVLLADRDPHQAAELLEMAVRLLPEVAPRELTGRDRQYQLGTGLELGAGMAADAAALALADDGAAGDRAARALSLLELGRAVLLTQSLETRGDLSDLRAREPALARRFVELRDALDQAQADPGTASSGDAAGYPGQQPDRRDLHQLAAGFRDVLAHIRAIHEFADFLQPPSAAQLAEQAGAGAIAILNVSQYRSDAILLRPQGGITNIPLPDLEYKALTAKVTAFYDFIGQANDDRETSEQREAAQRSIADTLEWLWDVAADPVLNELGYRQPPPAGAPWPRLWWVPCGLLGALPIHAAGYHRSDPALSVLDRVISSYTPTVRTLAYAREHAARGGIGPLPALAVAMPVTEGLPPLDFAAREVDYIRAHIPQAAVFVESGAGVTDQTPTRDRILRHMASCTVAHFACHGSNDSRDPSRSQLYLHDYADKPLTVAALSAVRLDRAQLAYLSACGTALNRNTHLLDEAIHLTAAFQLVGFARVIGTLWPINDNVSALIANSFYAGLKAGDGDIDVSRAAVALHNSQRAIRDAIADYPSLWAPYLHMGA
jgi:tetratricopeptide (TPR) repeat protein